MKLRLLRDRREGWKENNVLDVNDLLQNAKETYHSSITEANHRNQQMLFQVVNTLSYKKPLARYPSASSDSALVEHFKSFFSDKIPLIVTLCPWKLVTFLRVSTEYMAHLIKLIKVKTCALDSLPASVLTKCLPSLLPVITVITHPLISARFYWLLYITWCKITGQLSRNNPRSRRYLSSDFFGEKET